MQLPEPNGGAVEALAPTGTLRAAINLSNFLLVTGEDEAGDTRDEIHPQGKSGAGLAVRRQKRHGDELRHLGQRHVEHVIPLDRYESVATDAQHAELISFAR